jgi:hypothetical protein
MVPQYSARVGALSGRVAASRARARDAAMRDAAMRDSARFAAR